MLEDGIGLIFLNAFYVYVFNVFCTGSRQLFGSS